MDFYEDQSLKVEIHPLVKLLWESGVQYEAKVIESLKTQNPDNKFVEIGIGATFSGYSIKNICRYLGFQWDASDASCVSSIVWMNDYLNGQIDLKQKFCVTTKTTAWLRIF